LSKFPVKFPVSREFGQRKVSARLPPPPRSLGCRETRLHSSENRWKSPQFRNFGHRTGPERMSRCPPQPSLRAFFSAGQTRSPVSTTPLGECNAITNRWFGESDLTLRRELHQHQLTVGCHLNGSPINPLHVFRGVGAATTRVLPPPKSCKVREGRVWAPARKAGVGECVLWVLRFGFGLRAGAARRSGGGTSGGSISE
jgi:hypothetical protein